MKWILAHKALAALLAVAIVGGGTAAAVFVPRALANSEPETTAAVAETVEDKTTEAATEATTEEETTTEAETEPPTTVVVTTTAKPTTTTQKATTTTTKPSTTKVAATRPTGDTFSLFGVTDQGETVEAIFVKRDEGLVLVKRGEYAFSSIAVINGEVQSVAPEEWYSQVGVGIDANWSVPPKYQLVIMPYNMVPEVYTGPVEVKCWLGVASIVEVPQPI